MLLNCDRNRMNGPRFVPSGNRLDPYFCSRLATSPASRPFAALVLSRFMTSSVVMACQVWSLADLTSEAASISISPLSLADRSVTAQQELPGPVVKSSRRSSTNKGDGEEQHDSKGVAKAWPRPFGRNVGYCKE